MKDPNPQLMLKIDNKLMGMSCDSPLKTKDFEAIYKCKLDSIENINNLDQLI